MKRVVSEVVVPVVSEAGWIILKALEENEYEW